MSTRTVLGFRNRQLVIADPEMESVLKLAERAAQTTSPVLIVGESGTGKELIARYIHEKSVRKDFPFVAVNCAAIPEGLLEAELFGFERGAFTGAVYQRIGKFESANGGTLLLDEVSELPVTLQAKLLRVLQEGEIDRLGAKDSIPMTARIIATTNQDPAKLVHNQRFRSDLFYRLNVIRVDCPQLVGRETAIRELADVWLQQIAQKQGREKLVFAEACYEKLQRHTWPGNVRELQNVIERSSLVTEGDKIQAHHIDFFSGHAHAGDIPAIGTLAEVEKKHILACLEREGGNRTSAARVLGISVRTLRNKLREYSV